MFKLIIIITGFVFAFIGYRKTWYSTWAVLFNVLIAVYASIMTIPQVIEEFPVIRSYLGNFSYSVFILVTAVIVFAVMQLLAFKFFTAVYMVSFPKILNGAGAAVLGFLTGSVVAGFLLFLISITTLSDNSTVRLFTQDKQSADQANIIVLESCDFVHNISLQPNPVGVDKQMEKILTDWRRAVVWIDSTSPANAIFPVKPQIDE
jgi:hypothetical protein